jgi:hypothetical protein
LNNFSIKFFKGVGIENLGESLEPLDGGIGALLNDCTESFAKVAIAGDEEKNFFGFDQMESSKAKVSRPGPGPWDLNAEPELDRTKLQVFSLCRIFLALGVRKRGWGSGRGVRR